MDAMIYTALGQLNGYRSRLTPQQYRTIRGQILAGNIDGAMKGLQKLLEKRQSRYRPREEAPTYGNRKH